MKGAPMYCSKCGTQLIEGTSYCHKCGNKITPTSDNQEVPESTSAEENKELLDVMLISVEGDKINIIKKVKELTDIGLKEAKELIDKAPTLLKIVHTQEEAESIKLQLEEIGATITILKHTSTKSTENENSSDMVDSPTDLDTEKSNSTLSIKKSSKKKHFVQKGILQFKERWNHCSGIQKILYGLIIFFLCGFILCLIIAFLHEFGALLCAIVLIASFIHALTSGSDEEKKEIKKTIIQMSIWIIGISVFAYIITTKADFIQNIIEPGAGIKNSYMTQYSDTVTVENAFENYFTNGKWSTFKKDGYPYITFTGECEFQGQQVIARITFKILGEHYTVDHLDINGVMQDDWMLYSLLSSVYESY